MKLIFLTAFSLLPLTLSAQTTDTLRGKIGLILETETVTLPQIGVRYFLTNSTRVVLRSECTYEKNDYDNISSSTNKQLSLGASATIEYQIISIESAMLFGEMGIKLAHSSIQETIGPSQSGNEIIPSRTLTSHSDDLIGVIGVGAEYLFNIHLSLYCIQRLELTKTKGVDENKQGYSQTSFDIATSKIGIAIYF